MLSRLVLAAVFVSTLAFGFEGDGFAGKFESLPKAVKETAKAQMNDAFGVSITSAKTDQGWDYQINTRLNGKAHNIVIDEKGKLVALKDEADLATIPPAAKATLEKQTDLTQILLLEKVTEGDQVSYGATVRDTTQGLLIQLRVAPDGTLKSRK